MHPAFVIIISLFIVGIIINNCIINEQFLKVRLILSIINLFIWAGLFLLYDEYIYQEALEIWINSYAIMIYLIFGLILFNAFKNAIIRTNHYKLFTDAIKHTDYNIYYVVDEKERIKDMSQSMLDEIGLTKEAVLGKKIFDIFDKTIRFNRFNDIEVTNLNVRDFYKEYKGVTKKGKQEKREIIFQNCDGKEVVLTLTEQPVYVLNKYRGRINFGSKKSEEARLNIEKELGVKNKELEGIRHKFIAMLELSEEAIFYIDYNQKYLWGTDNYKSILGLPVNMVGLDEFKTFISPEDMLKYLKVFQNLTPENPNYTITYRFQKGNGFVWVKEKGKRIFEDDNNIILGFISKMETDHFEKTGVSDLDNVKNEIELISDLNTLYAKNRPFELAIIRTNNIPEINERYGRGVGNMMMGEYVKRLRLNFVSENANLYRISGLDFALTITEVRKMDMLSKILDSDSSSLSLAMEYGGINEKILAKIGIAQSTKDANQAKELIACAKKALKMATNPNFKKDCCYYREIK